MKINSHLIPMSVIYILAIIFGVLTVCSIVFRIYKNKKPTAFFEELIARTRSWWFIAIGVAVLITAPPIVGTLLVAYVSFVALREMFSISRFREADRTALFAAYLAVPVQYYFAYHNYYQQFLYFIPLIMFIGIPIILVLVGKTEHIGRSMSLIPSVLLLTVFMLSHIVLLFNLKFQCFFGWCRGIDPFLNYANLL